MSAVTVNMGGQSLIFHSSSAAVYASQANADAASSAITLPKVYNGDTTFYYPDSTTVACAIVIKQLDGETILSTSVGVGSGVGPRTLNPQPDPLQVAADASTILRAHPQYLESGEHMVSRHLNWATTTGPTTGQMALTFFTALKSESCVSMAMITGTTAAAATPTLCQYGLYEVDASGNIALVASTTNDTSLFSVANTRYSKAFTTPYTRVAGRRYAFGALVVSAGACPDFLQLSLGATGTITTESVRLPVLSCKLTGLAALPASETVANVISAGTRQVYFGTIHPA